MEDLLKNRIYIDGRTDPMLDKPLAVGGVRVKLGSGRRQMTPDQMFYEPAAERLDKVEKFRS